LVIAGRAEFPDFVAGDVVPEGAVAVCVVETLLQEYADISGDVFPTNRSPDGVVGGGGACAGFDASFDKVEVMGGARAFWGGALSHDTLVK
jgi:hypothetical protein